MTPEQFLESIQPGLTRYGALITFSIASFYAGRFFWKLEDELITKNIERLKYIVDSFRDAQIAPLLNKYLVDAKHAAFEEAINGLTEELNPKRLDNGAYVRVQIGTTELQSATSSPALEGRLQTLKQHSSTDVSDFLSSASGVALFEKLEKAYRFSAELAINYRSVKKYCMLTAYTFFLLTISFLFGLLKPLIGGPDLIWDFWLLSSIEVGLVGVSFAAILEFKRRRLLDQWERLQLYGRF